MPHFPISSCAPLAVLLAGLAATPTMADDVLVTLASGDTIRATVVSDANGTLVLKHPVLGELKIDRASVVKVEPAPAPAAAAPAATPNAVASSGTSEASRQGPASDSATGVVATTRCSATHRRRVARSAGP